MICNSHFRSEDFTTPQDLKLRPEVTPIDFRHVDNFCIPTMDPKNVLRTYPSVSTSSKNVFLLHFPFFSQIREISSVHQCKVASLAASQRIQSVPEINILREKNTTNNCDTVASTSLVMVQNAEPAISPETKGR